MINKNKGLKRIRRHVRIEKRLKASGLPRVSFHRSLKHVYASVTDQQAGKTILSVSTLSEEVKSSGAKGPTRVSAGKVGEILAKKCIEKGIKKVVFDRGGWKYHGRVKALAEAARKGGLEF